MSDYIKITQDQLDRARRTDLAALLRSQGETVRRCGSEHQWLHGAEKITLRGNLWYNQYRRQGGDAISFARQFFGKTFPQAVLFLLGESAGTVQTAPSIPQAKREKPVFALPERNKTMNRVTNYLTNERGIAPEVVQEFINVGLIYESADYHNAVFIGRDDDGEPHHAHLRGTGRNSSFKGNIAGGAPQYSFHWRGWSDRIYLFEAPIDMLSFISMHQDNWQAHSYAACCGVADHVLFWMLEQNPFLKTVVLCLDNDAAGEKATCRIAEKLSEMNYFHEILVPIEKDWNEDLLSLWESEVEVCYPAMQF